VSATGVYLAFRRIRRDIGALLRMVGGVLRPLPSVPRLRGREGSGREASSTPQSALDG
jgi:hypothetical protein